MMTGKSRKLGQAAGWAAVRRDLEKNGGSVRVLARRHGVAESDVDDRRGSENWQRPACHGLGRTRAQATAPSGSMAQRLKDLLAGEISDLQARRRCGGESDSNETVRALHMLAGTTQKIIDIARKEKADHGGDNNCRIAINDASRQAFAHRFEALADSWDPAGNSGKP